MIGVICAQRDRLKARVAQLEEDNARVRSPSDTLCCQGDFALYAVVSAQYCHYVKTVRVYYEETIFTLMPGHYIL